MEKRTEPFTGADCCRTMYQPVPNGGLNNEGLVAILKLEILKKKYINIPFKEYPKFSYKRCLVLYFNFEPQDTVFYIY